MMTAGPWHGRQPRPSSPTVHAVAHSDTDIMEPPLLEAELGRVVRRATRGGHHLQIYPEMKSRLHTGVNKMDHGLSGVGQQTSPLLCPGLVGCQRQIPSMFVHLPSVVGLALAASALTVLAGGSNSICLAQDAIQTVSRFTSQEADTADLQPVKRRP